MNENKRLVWLDISASYSHSSLALPAIEATRCGDDYHWSVVRGTIASDLFSLTRELYGAKPTILAATLWLFNHDVVVELCARLKALLPDVVVVLGGAEFNGDNEAFLRRNGFVDYVFRGEGEREFHRFLLGESVERIVGLCYLDAQGEYHDNGAAKVADFATLPIPETSRFFNFDSPFVQLETSRGCFNSCAFCVSGGDRPIRVRDVEDMERRIELVRQSGVHDVRVLDRTFNYSKSRFSALLKLFRGYDDMNFHLEIHPALLSTEMLDQLAQMPHGRLHLEAGMQSLDDRVIEACERIGGNDAALTNLARLCAMENFETHTDLIAGLPHYTFSQILADVRTLSQIHAAEIQLELLKLLPGTKLRREAKQLGIIYNPCPPYEVMQTPALLISEMDRVRLLSKLIDKFYNSKSWQPITRRLINDSPNFLECFLEYVSASGVLDKPIGVERCGALLYDFCKGWQEGDYLDDISLRWIENGLSMRREEAGTISKATTLPPSMVRQHNVHYYLWEGRSRRCIILFDRSQNHSYPSAIVEL